MERLAFLKSVIAVPLAAVGLSQSPFVPRYYDVSVVEDYEWRRSRQAIFDLLRQDMQRASDEMHHQLMQTLYG